MSAPEKFRLAVLISGRGSNLQALIAACEDPDFPAGIAVVVSNNRQAAGLSYARKSGIPTEIIDHNAFPDRAKFDQELHRKITDYAPDLICLAGFMRILGAAFIKNWHDRILNIHPSLLPAFKGLGTHEQVLESGVRITGCSVHIVRPEMDSGPLIIQAAVAVDPLDTPETLARRVLEQEHRIYPEAVRMFAQRRVMISENRVEIQGARTPSGALLNPTPTQP